MSSARRRKLGRPIQLGDHVRHRDASGRQPYPHRASHGRGIPPPQTPAREQCSQCSHCLVPHCRQVPIHSMMLDGRAQRIRRCGLHREATGRMESNGEAYRTQPRRQRLTLAFETSSTRRTGHPRLSSACGPKPCVVNSPTPPAPRRARSPDTESVVHRPRMHRGRSNLPP